MGLAWGTRHRLLAPALLTLALLAVAGGPAGAYDSRKVSSGDATLRQLLEARLPALRAADRAAAAGNGSIEAIQAQYDLNRDFQEALAGLPPTTEGCKELRNAARAYAEGQIKEAEGFDRPSPAVTAAGVRTSTAAVRDLDMLPHSCTKGPVVAPLRVHKELDNPKSDEAYPALLRAKVPAGTTVVDVAVNGQVRGPIAPKAGVAQVYLKGSYGQWNVSFRFKHAQRLLGVAESPRTWLLPRSAKAHHPPTIQDRKLAAQLGLLASAFGGKSGLWVADLTTGSFAGWNEDARFPAASTVKLAVLIAGLGKFGSRPERSPVAYDLEAMAGWSSNLAANRLLRKIGGTESGGSNLAEATLRRLGATSSSYTGDYRIGTAVRVAGSERGAPDPPPLVSQRVTTARDLGRILYVLHSGAMGDPHALKLMRLTRHQARVGLVWLLNSEPKADNLGLLRPNLDNSVPLAQKNGWISDVRHTAGIVYEESGPKIVVVLTYQPRITRAEAAGFAGKVLKAVLAA